MQSPSNTQPNPAQTSETQLDPPVQNAPLQPIQPPVPEPTPAALPQKGPEDSLATASLVLGIVGILGSILPICGMMFAIVGIVLGIKGRESKLKSRQAKIGIVLSILGLLASLFFGFMYLFLDVLGELAT